MPAQTTDGLAAVGAAVAVLAWGIGRGPPPAGLLAVAVVAFLLAIGFVHAPRLRQVMQGL